MGARDLGRMALVMNDAEDSQHIINSITSRQVFNDPTDAQTIMGQHRVGMLKNKYNRLVSKFNFHFYSEEEIIAPTAFID
jgi:hypothetical protein